MVYTPNLNDGVHLAYGHIDYEGCLIELTDNEGIAHEKYCMTLWHEILHGIRESNGMEIENEEDVIEMFARGIYQVLQDNGKRLFDIMEGDDARN